MVVSDVGGLKELVPDESTGVTFKAGNADDLASKCSEILDSPDAASQMGKCAREYVLEHRRWSRIVEKYAEVYETAKANHGGRA